MDQKIHASAAHLVAALAQAALVNPHMGTDISISEDGVSADWDTPYGPARSQLVQVEAGEDYRYRLMVGEEVAWEVGVFHMMFYGRENPQVADSGPTWAGAIWPRVAAMMVSDAVGGARKYL